MKKSLMFVLVILMFSSLVNAKVFINEIEINPESSDTGNEWIELYNNGLAPVNISNWKIIDNSGVNNLLGGSLINASGFFVINSSHSISNLNQNFTLLNNTNNIVDFTIRVNDSSPSAGDNRAWARVPDGSSVWQLQNQTRGTTNLDLVNPNITRQDRHPEPVFEDDNVYLNATIDENYLKEVKINGTWEGNWEVFTVFTITNNITERNFTYMVSRDDLESGEFIEWYYLAEDTSGNVAVGDIQNFTVRVTTLVNITPSSPDGLNGYYVSIPSFTFLGDTQAVSTYYRFDSLQWNLFIGPFLFDINGTLGGIERLDFFSSFGNRNESIHNITIKVDVFKPELTRMNPTGVIRSNNVNINALIDDKYQSNSGLNLGSLNMTLNNTVIIYNITSSDSLKATVNSTANLSEGNYTVNITIYDNAGNLGGGIWSFIVNLTSHILTVNSPVDGNYGSNRIRFDINGNIPGKITFKDNDNNQILCNNCVTINKTLSLRDGYHNLTIRVGSEEVNRSIFIDSEEPKIIKILPKSNAFVSVVDFSIKYTEEFLEKIVLYYGNSTNIDNSETLLNCSSGRNIICNKTINLTSLDNQEVFFFFNVSDKITNISSKINTVFVDVTRPGIIFNDNINGTTIIRENRVRFDLSLSENVKKLEYKDLSSPRPSFRTLCSNCALYNKTTSFSRGEHIIELRTTDKAKNEGINFTRFTVI